MFSMWAIALNMARLITPKTSCCESFSPPLVAARSWVCHCVLMNGVTVLILVAVKFTEANLVD